MVSRCNRVTEVLADLIDKMLAMDPRKRLTASEALAHDFFNKEAPKPCQPNEYRISLITSIGFLSSMVKIIMSSLSRWRRRRKST